MQIKSLLKLLFCLMFPFYFATAHANGCNDFFVFIDNHTKETVYAVYQTPNASTEEKVVKPGGEWLGLAVNVDNEHDDTWELIKIYKEDKKTLIYSGALAKPKLSRWIIGPTEGLEIYKTGNLIHDANYTMQGHIDRLGACNQQRGDSPGGWYYTLYKD